MRIRQRRSSWFRRSQPIAAMLLVMGLVDATEGGLRAADGPVRALTVTGRVLDAQTGKQLDNANVVDANGAGVTTDGSGRFELAVTVGDSITVSHIGYISVSVPAVSALVIRMQPRVLPVRTVRVTGGLLEDDLGNVPASVTVLQADEIAASAGGHLQDLVQSVPNLNWAGSTSRPRYFQVRGIGGRSHYAGEGPPNFAVGMQMDDVDLSGMGMAAMLVDVDQVEVFKGPQSSSFGPNAMAGLINMRSADPSQAPLQSVSVSAGNDALIRYNGSFNFPVNDRLAVRLSFHEAQANGFRDNVFVGRDDTNRRREHLARAKVRYHTAGMTWLGTLFRADADNHFDAWAADNNEDLITYSDSSGQDRQLTKAGSLRGELPVARLGGRLTTITSYSTTRLNHGFDGDWGNDAYWAAEPFAWDPTGEYGRYAFVDRTVRDRDTFTQELRLLTTTQWKADDQLVVGAYIKDLRETDDAAGFLFGGDAAALDSRFDVNDVAFYGQYGLPLTTALRVSANFRVDRHAISYHGTADGAAPIAFDVTDWLTGGRLALQYDIATGNTLYASASQGYRPGGVNQHPRLAADNRPYDPEYAVNLELGLRSSSQRASSSVTLFHTMRRRQQVSLSTQQEPGNPNSFLFFIANASSGRNSGIEWEQTYRPVERLNLFGSLAYLNTRVDAYTFETAAGESQTLGDRASAHAPEYSLRGGAHYRTSNGIFGRLEVTSMDEFFFSDSHNQRSEPYQLVNGSLGYERGNWKLNLWGRNLLDERYATRGFYFGLEPPKFDTKLYKSYGDPRQFGVTLSARFEQ